MAWSSLDSWSGVGTDVCLDSNLFFGADLEDAFEIYILSKIRTYYDSNVGPDSLLPKRCWGQQQDPKWQTIFARPAGIKMSAHFAQIYRKYHSHWNTTGDQDAITSSSAHKN